jgi:hypothetical protein
MFLRHPASWPLQVQQAVRRLKRFPALAVWGGNNENEMFIACELLTVTCIRRIRRLSL